MPQQRRGFDYSASMRSVVADMASRLPELSHVDLRRVGVGVCTARSRSLFGVYATLTPLRFAGGAVHQTVRGRRMRIESVPDGAGGELLYLLNFYLPRFADLPLEEKLTTAVHELWHISPRFDGDLRRHAGRCYAHGGSRRRYDAEMARLARRWLQADPPAPLYDFLSHDFDSLRREYGAVHGRSWRAPKLVQAG